MYRIQVGEQSVTFSDAQPQRKRSRECYERVAPIHTPHVEVEIWANATSEKLSVVIPTDIANKLPFLRECAASRSTQDSTEDSGPDDNDNGATLNLPAGPWALLIVLNILLDRDYDVEQALLAPSSPPLAVEAFLVRFAFTISILQE